MLVATVLFLGSQCRFVKVAIVGVATHIGKRRLFLALNNSSRPNDNLE